MCLEPTAAAVSMCAVVVVVVVGVVVVVVVYVVPSIKSPRNLQIYRHKCSI